MIFQDETIAKVVAIIFVQVLASKSLHSSFSACSSLILNILFYIRYTGRHLNVQERIAVANGLPDLRYVQSLRSLLSVSYVPHVDKCHEQFQMWWWIYNEKKTVCLNFSGGVACALGGAALGATGLAGPPTSHLTAALLMIGELKLNSYNSIAKREKDSTRKSVPIQSIPTMNES